MTSPAPEARAQPTPKLNLNAYWYSFTATGCQPIDKILHAIAQAGKGHHSTEYWADTGNEGEPSYIDRIQDAANSAAASWATAAERDRLAIENEQLRASALRVSKLLNKDMGLKALQLLKAMAGESS